MSDLSDNKDQRSYNIVLAWGVHLFTSTGLVFAFLALLCVEREQWNQAFLWLFLCFVIDSLDGTLARKVGVQELLPNIDGKAIDFVIDFAAYAIIPIYFFYNAKMAPEAYILPLSILMLLSSALYYGKKEMVVDGQYFLGFPVLWNIAVFYMFFIFGNQLWVNTVLVVMLSIMHFVPIRFAYPSRARAYLLPHALMSIIGLSAALAILCLYPSQIGMLKAITIAAGTYFLVFAFYDSWPNRNGQHTDPGKS